MHVTAVCVGLQLEQKFDVWCTGTMICTRLNACIDRAEVVDAVYREVCWIACVDYI